MDSIRYYGLKVNALNLNYAGDAKTYFMEGKTYGGELDFGGGGKD